jgi:hypothetical protein
VRRIFKLVRHFAGLQSLIYTLKQAYKELGLLFLLVAVAILTVRFPPASVADSLAIIECPLPSLFSQSTEYKVCGREDVDDDI